MKRSVFSTLLLAGVLLSMSLTTGCQRPEKGITTIPGQSPRVGQGLGAGPQDFAGPVGLGQHGMPTGEDMAINPRPLGFDERDQDRDIFAAFTVYFDFDRSSIRPSETHKLESVAAFLQTNPGGDILIEGHCDERGTDGYNEALGERRALSVRDYLLNLGVNPNRLHTVSFGSTRPAVAEQNEAAYALNRRGEFILLLPAQ
jgi:peptidoglycan-associated lipoprotein